MMVVTVFLNASSDALKGDTSLFALKYSALSSASYYGDFGDIFINPASLPLLNGGKSYVVSYAPSESYDTSQWGNEPLSYIQNLTSEFSGTVVSGPVALSAKVSSALDNRKISSDGFAYYDIYSSFDIELALSYSFFNHLSIGARLGGGNSVGRINKRMTGLFNAIGNAWFSPYEQISGSERFNVNLGSLLYFDNFSFGLVFNDILGLSFDSTFFKHFVANTNVSISYKGDEYNKEGDLLYLVPRIAFDMNGIVFSSSERSVSVQGDLTLQLLKNVFVDAGVKYSYIVSEKDGNSNEITVTLLGSYGDFSLLFNFAFFSSVKENFKVGVVFSYAK